MAEETFQRDKARPCSHVTHELRSELHTHHLLLRTQVVGSNCQLPSEAFVTSVRVQVKSSVMPAKAKVG